MTDEQNAKQQTQTNLKEFEAQVNKLADNDLNKPLATTILSIMKLFSMVSSDLERHETRLVEISLVLNSTIDAINKLGADINVDYDEETHTWHSA